MSLASSIDSHLRPLSLPCSVTATHAAASNATRFRAAALAAFSATPPAMVGINFFRTPLGELGGGHMSPLAAYEPRTDRFLLLDVSRYKYPPVWVTTAVLFAAMNTLDADADASRGWVVVSVPAAGAAPLPPLPPPPPAVNNTAIRLCLAALPTDDGDAVNACIRGGSQQQQQACAPSAAAAAGGGGGSGPWVLVLIFAMSTTYLAISLRREQRARAAEAAGRGGGGGGGHAEMQGVAMLPR
jgi:hypothetical protein